MTATEGAANRTTTGSSRASARRGDVADRKDFSMPTSSRRGQRRARHDASGASGNYSWHVIPRVGPWSPGEKWTMICNTGAGGQRSKLISVARNQRVTVNWGRRLRSASLIRSASVTATPGPIPGRTAEREPGRKLTWS